MDLQKNNSSQNDLVETAKQFEFMKQATVYLNQLASELGRKPKCNVTTFGCQMNARDSEKLLGVLKEIGYEETDSEEEADLVLYNTCTVRDNANQRVYGRLGHLNGLKQKKKHMKIILCGCMMQEQTVIEKLQKSYRFVDLVFGTHNLFCFAEYLVRMFESEGRMIVNIWDSSDRIMETLPMERKFAFKSGVNIMFGCNNFCSYCIVPYVRGRERSRDYHEILDEIRALAEDGVREVMLLGQNVNSYGKNLEDPISFAKLLQKVEEIDGIHRIRFMTSHPKDLSQELIDVMASSTKICRHLHLPVQSGSNKILQAMNRRYTREQYLDLVRRLKEAMPDLAITTDLIMGFPGETDEDVEDTIDLIRQVQYDNAFTFIYSKRTGTPAAAMEQVPEELTKERFERVLAVVQETARNRVALLAGQVAEVLVEEINDHDPSLMTGRMGNNTLVHFAGTSDLIGSFVQVKLEDYRGFYYLGHLVEDGKE